MSFCLLQPSCSDRSTCRTGCSRESNSEDLRISLLQQGTDMDHGRHDANGYEGSTGRKVTLVSLIKHHLRDWIAIVIMGILELVDYLLVPPFKRFVNEPMMANLRYPHKGETVPTWSVGVIAVAGPFFLFLAVYFKKRSIRDFHSAFLGLAMAIVITALFTDGIKNLVGYPRPDFFHRCFPDGVAVYTDDADRRVICHPNVSKQKFRDAFKSFPSGHVAWAFAGLGYTSFYLAGKMSLFDRRAYASRVFWVLLPLFVATLIAISRVNDYQHSWYDIIAAALLGTPIAYICYRQFYPSFYAREWAGYPYEYQPQGIFSHGLHGPHALPMMNSQFNSTVTPSALEEMHTTPDVYPMMWRLDEVDLDLGSGGCLPATFVFMARTLRASSCIIQLTLSTLVGFFCCILSGVSDWNRY